MRVSATEEYGLRCLLAIARRAPAGSDEVVPLRVVAESEGLSADYAAKLVSVLRDAGLVIAARGATGGYRLARPASSVTAAEVLKALDPPRTGAAFCEAHRGQLDRCTHHGGCSLVPIWSAVESAVDDVLSRVSLADLLAGEA